MTTNFVLIDFENVQPTDLSLLRGGSFRIKVFLGSNQGKIPLEMVRALQAFGPDAEYIQIDGTGRNALDFHIAYYIGRLSAENAGSSFQVISRDTGFDPLLRHLASQGISWRRWTSIADVPGIRVPSAGPSMDRVDTIIQNLMKRRAARPRTLKTLRGSIKTIFVNQLADADLEELIEQLKARGVVKVTGEKVQYLLPS